MRRPSDAEDSRPRAARLAALLGHEGGGAPDVAAIDALVGATLSRLGLERPAPDAAEVDDDPRVLAWWLLRMARTTLAREVEPLAPVDVALIARLEPILAARPARDDDHAQLHIDTASTLRRATAILEHLGGAEGPILAVGDDDGVCIALALLGAKDLAVVDVDPRVVTHVERAASEAGARVHAATVDIYGEPVPEPLRRACIAAVTDPPRSADAALPFVVFAHAALRRDVATHLFVCDHPDWTLDHERLHAGIEELDVTPVRTWMDLHAYPLDEPAFPKLADAERALGTEPGALRAILRETSAWSHLHVFRRAGDRT